VFNKFPGFSYRNILSVCALFSSTITAKEVYHQEFGVDSMALIPAFTAFSLCIGKSIYDSYGYSKPFLFGSLTVMAYTVSNVMKGCGDIAMNDRLSGTIIAFSGGLIASIVAGVICHQVNELAKYADGDRGGIRAQR